MRDGKELVDYVDELLSGMGKSRYWLSEQCDITPTALTMCKKRNSLPTVNVLYRISEVFKVTIEELLGVDIASPGYTPEVKRMADMLMQIPPEIRKGIEASITVYYNSEIEKKDEGEKIG